MREATSEASRVWPFIFSTRQAICLSLLAQEQDPGEEILQGSVEGTDYEGGYTKLIHQSK